MITKNEARVLKRFLEEFSWLMESYSKIDLSKASELIDDSLNETKEIRKAVGAYESKNPNKHFLIGALPSLFMDQKIFRRNEDIAEFASSVLNIEIGRYSRSARAEVIGRVICQTVDLDDKKLDQLVKALAVLAKNDAKTNSIISKRESSNFSWNDIINELSSD